MIRHYSNGCACNVDNKNYLKLFSADDNIK